MLTFHDIMGLWPTLAAFASDVGVPYGHVKQWKHRGTVPAHHFAAVVRAAFVRGYPVSLETLVSAAEQKQRSRAA